MTGKVFANEKDLNEQLLKALNEADAAVFQYKFHFTEKYIHIRCTSCTLFSVWLRNVDQLDMSNFYKQTDDTTSKKKSHIIDEEKKDKLNMTLFRKINLYHLSKCHNVSDIKFAAA